MEGRERMSIHKRQAQAGVQIVQRRSAAVLQEGDPTCLSAEAARKLTGACGETQHRHNTIQRRWQAAQKKACMKERRA